MAGCAPPTYTDYVVVTHEIVSFMDPGFRHEVNKFEAIVREHMSRGFMPLGPAQLFKGLDGRYVGGGIYEDAGPKYIMQTLCKATR